MVTRAQVLELLEEGHSYETAARELHIPAGRAFMIATGVPADGSEQVTPGSTQHLSNPPHSNPTRKEHVLQWVRERARRELNGSPGKEQA
ncbi:MAG: hypothetical protein ACYDC2_09410 [Solirubrobacteraceae bacterium]